jgi:hypothetical protein
MLLNVLSRVLVIETGFLLVIGSINHPQVVTTINYNTVTEFHSTSTARQSSQSDLLPSFVLLVLIRSLVRMVLPCLSFTNNWTTTVTALTSPYLELNTSGAQLFGILPVSRYMDFDLNSQKTSFYCCARNIIPWTSHVTPSQYCWSVTSCACMEMCLPSSNLETDRVTPLFHCWYVYYLETADSVAQPFFHRANTPQYVYTTHTGPLSVQAQYSRSCSIISSSRYQQSCHLNSRMLNRRRA